MLRLTWGAPTLWPPRSSSPEVDIAQLPVRHHDQRPPPQGKLQMSPPQLQALSALLWCSPFSLLLLPYHWRFPQQHSQPHHAPEYSGCMEVYRVRLGVMVQGSLSKILCINIHSNAQTVHMYVHIDRVLQLLQSIPIGYTIQTNRSISEISCNQSTNWCVQKFTQVSTCTHALISRSSLLDPPYHMVLELERGGSSILDWGQGICTGQ